MSLRRWVTVLAALLISGVAILSHAEGVSTAPSSVRSALFGPSDRGVQKDDSNLTVVEASADGTAPVIDTATKKKKPSFWDNKIFHPTKWFSSSKKK